MACIEYLDRIAYQNGSLQQAFLVSPYTCPIEWNKRKVILFGVGELSVCAEYILKEKGIDIFGYADNSEKLWGRILRGRKIYSPYELFGKDEYYFIITVKYDIATVRLQFMIHDCQNYSIFFTHSFHDFQEECNELQEILMKSMNFICFRDEKIENALPYIQVAGEGDRRQLGSLNFMMYSTLWAHWAYLWVRELICLHKYHSVLEVGPGYGLMSLTLLMQFRDIHIDWLLFKGEDCSENLENSNSRFDLSLKKIKAAYMDRVQEYYCRLERDKLPDKNYGLIILTEVFEHFVLNPIETMKKLADRLESDGRIILTTPNWRHLPIYQTWKDMPGMGITEERYNELSQCGHAYQYNKEELLEIFHEAGLCVEKYSMSDSNNHNFVLVKE